MTSIQRASELMGTPFKNQPVFATEYARYLCSRIGVCGEVYLTAYAAYAEIVENLECDDPAYAADEIAREWFRNRLTRV